MNAHYCDSISTDLGDETIDQFIYCVLQMRNRTSLFVGSEIIILTTDRNRFSRFERFLNKLNIIIDTPQNIISRNY